jgi:hypothetical protein
LHVPWGASSFHLKRHFVVIIVFDFTWYHFVLNNIEGVMIPCLCTLYFNSNWIFYAQTLGSFLILFRSLFWSYHNIFIKFVLSIIWLLSWFIWSFLCYLILFLFVIFDPQYSLISSKFSYLDMCICFQLYFWFMHTLCRNSLYIGLLSFPPISAIGANGGEVSWA